MHKLSQPSPAPFGSKPDWHSVTLQFELYFVTLATPQASQAVLFESGFKPASQLSTMQPEL